MIYDILLTVGLLGILFFGLAWYMSNRVITYPREIKKEDWNNYNLKPERLEFEAKDGIKIAGVFLAGTNGVTIILLHGYGRSKEQMLPQAAFLNEAGYNILMFDFRGSGESGGNFLTFGHMEQYDLEGAIKYLQKRGDVDINNLGLLGFSMGGAVAIMKSGDLPEIKAIVISSTYARFKTVIWKNFKEYLRGIPFFPIGYITLWIIKFRTGIWIDKINPIKYVHKLKGRPLFLIHGAHDKKIPIEGAMDLYKEAPWLEEFWFVKGADHDDLYNVTKKEYQEKVLNFYSKHLLS
ncbi:MAG: alpha/beta hydrolase [Candidatus Kerfeldbacteria bacterium]